VTCCAVGAEGGRILSGDASGTVIAWDLETGNAMYSFAEHSKEVTCVAITMDGSVGLSGSRDGWIYAWGLGKGVRLASLQAHVPIVQLHCSWDAARIVAQPERSSHLPILCLHNTPAVLVPVDPRKTKRHGSVSSTGSSVSMGSAMSGHQPMGQHERESAVSVHSKVRPFPPPILRKDSQKVFAHLERSRSRMSITENPTSVTKVNVSGDKASGQAGSVGQKSSDSQPTTTSSVCILL